MKGFIFGAILMILVGMVPAIMASTGYELGVNVTQVKVNGDTITPNEVLRTQFVRGNELDVKIILQSYGNESFSNVEVTAAIYGDEHYLISQTTDPFDVEPDVIYTKDLTLKLPDIMQQDNYKLRIMVADKYGAMKIYNYNLKIDTERHKVIIKDIEFTPDNEVKAGRGFITVARVRNMGEKTENDVKVDVSIPDLGISASDYIDELKSDESKSTEEIYLRIPSDAETGDYDVVVKVTYDEGFKEVEETHTIKVVGTQQQTTPSAPSEEETTVTVGTTTQDIEIGGNGAIYPITITNEGSTSKSYTLTIDGTSDWATTRISPSSVVIVNAGESKTAYVYVAANENAQVGEHTFSVKVATGDTEKDILLKAVVSEPESKLGGAKLGLQITLIVLIVILIILAIILGITRSRKTEETEMTQTYY